MFYLNILFTLLRLIINSKIVRDLIEMSSTGTLTGSSLIIQIQIAIVGIIIVLGVFFIWRAVSRIEQRLNVVEINQKTLSQCQKPSSLNLNKGGSMSMNCPVTTGSCSFTTNPNIQTFSTAAEFTEIDEFADEMIKVFGKDSEDREFREIDDEEYENPPKPHKDSESDKNKATTTATDIEITPVKQVPVNVQSQSQTQAQAPVKPNTSTVIDEVLSEADTEPGNPLSKSKLKQMNIEKLKAICVHHNISAEGSKSVLISRILGEIRD